MCNTDIAFASGEIHSDWREQVASPCRSAHSTRDTGTDKVPVREQIAKGVEEKGLQVPCAGKGGDMKGSVAT